MIEKPMFEKVLGTLLGEGEDARVELVQVAEPGQAPTLEIRLMRDGGQLGWLVQKRIRLASGQIGDLQQALNLMDLDARQAPAPRQPSHLRLVPFDEAL